MAQAGAHVVVPILADRVVAVAAEIDAAGGRAEGFGLDVLDDTALEGAILAAAERHGRLDILHSHAGVQVPGRLDQVDVDQMDLSWRLNVRAHFIAAKAAMPVMAARRQGSIIITSSNSGVHYDREMIAYCTTKHAVIAMVRQIAVDFARHNVRCNALCPGFVDTVFNAGFEIQMGGRAALEDYVRDTIPMGRFGSPRRSARDPLSGIAQVRVHDRPRAGDRRRGKPLRPFYPSVQILSFCYPTDVGSVRMSIVPCSSNSQATTGSASVMATLGRRRQHAQRQQRAETLGKATAARKHEVRRHQDKGDQVELRYHHPDIAPQAVMGPLAVDGAGIGPGPRDGRDALRRQIVLDGDLPF